MFKAARTDLTVGARCHWEFHHGDRSSAEAEAWSYMQVEAVELLRQIRDLLKGLAGVK